MDWRRHQFERTFILFQVGVNAACANDALAVTAAQRELGAHNHKCDLAHLDTGCRIVELRLALEPSQLRHFFAIKYT